jgi:hypothetical protein
MVEPLTVDVYVDDMMIVDRWGWVTRVLVYTYLQIFSPALLLCTNLL